MKRFSALFFLLVVLCVTIMMLCYPQAAYQGACRGLETWGTHLLPALLPFFIVSDLLLSMGFVHFLGTLLEPVMRPLFRLPGEAGFAVALGFTSGFPTGAVLTASLKEQNLCTEQEAARLAAFTNNSSPLFLLISIPVSMLHQPQLGLLLLASHYCANVTIGVLLRFTTPARFRTIKPRNLWRTAASQLQQHQAQASLPLGSMLGKAIQHGIDSIIKIGGFVVLFSVLLSLLQTSGLLLVLQNICAVFLRLFQQDPQLSSALSAGIFEMTLGTQLAAESQVDILPKLMVISFILGWSGLSIQAQVSSILASQNISPKIYLLCRPLQGFLAAIYLPLLTILFPEILSIHTAATLQAISPFFPAGAFVLFPVMTILTLLLLSACFHLCGKIKQHI